MSKNVHDAAYDLEKALGESDDFQELKSLYAQVNADESVKSMFDNFRNMQVELQQKQMQGEQISEDEAQKAQQLFELVQQNDVISKLMSAEQRVSMLIQDINKIVTKPLEELYGTPEQPEQ
ncbi:YlbF family regulator [Pseudalkalibacillus decolorationis]|uniref:YlbF family regulator n=1 Tax=Pseudalkalibacillus decolorationis TaxID=163879 RepID=UPI0021486750|nr:YlbF family regulator [Pseudalkalibacillus decolorationis]